VHQIDLLPSKGMSPCGCGSPVLIIEFFEDGNWTVSCHQCGRHWEVRETDLRQMPCDRALAEIVRDRRGCHDFGLALLVNTL